MAFTLEELSNEFDSDLHWRIRELSSLKAAILGANRSTDQAVFLRALVTIAYAHWEGYVRRTARKYFDFITLRKFRFSALEEQMYVNRFLPRLDSLSRNRESVESRSNLVREILNSKSDRFSKINSTLIDTRSNLNFAVFSEICLICQIDTSPFASKKDFIDAILLKRRNSIAHGEDTFISSTDADEIISTVLELMRNFKTALENKAYTKGYLAA